MKEYNEWFKENHDKIFEKYGECFLIIDIKDFKIIASYSIEQLRESVKFYHNGIFNNRSYIHQECCKELRGYTAFCFSPILSINK